MAGNSIGSKKGVETKKLKYGLTEDGKVAINSKAGKIGGKVKNPKKGFGSMDPERLKEISRKNSRRKDEQV